MKIISALSAGAAVALAISTGFPASAAEPITGRANVIDGDTIVVGGQHIRLHGIDAPEKAQGCEKGGADYACGSEATEYLREIVGRSDVSCDPRDVDRYHRIVATCFVGQTDIGAEMVSAGHAVAFARYSSDYIAVEQQARNAKRGLWAGAFTNPADYRRAKREGRF